MLKIIKSIAEWQQWRQSFNNQHMSIGFVPTMGNLHQGHLELVKRAQDDNDLVVVSIFVNPTQFNNPDDLQKYPRTLQQDLEQLKALDVDMVFIPAIQDMYPLEYRYQIKEVKFSQKMEGQHRPGHFDGVLTVVLKLLNLVQPQRVYFGEKDYQQYQLIKDMVSALFLPIEVIACPIVRDAHGLALSSRNNRLSQQGLDSAREFAQLLSQQSRSIEATRSSLKEAGYQIDYVEDYQGRRYAAVFVDDVRLIDNIEIE
ncbi:MAG: pantoate--beta-alanine ligase [Coxiellaceae bacterium]|nr:pantoate--beta-alanine ligase [Coxiellaceae bacterium]